MDSTTGQLSGNVFCDLVKAVMDRVSHLKPGENLKAGEPKVEVVFQRTAKYRKLKHELSPDQGGLLKIAGRQVS
jgi:hypothetical protein